MSLLGRSSAALPPIELVDRRPADVSRRAEAFTRTTSATIYLLSTSGVFREALQTEARCDEFDAFKKLASILVHEAWHVRYGGDERGAYNAQLDALMLLGAGPATWIYREVTRSMRDALKATPPPNGKPLANSTTRPYR
jgi:hypothetical protein